MDLEGLKNLKFEINKCNACKLDGHVRGVSSSPDGRIDLVCVGDAPKSADFERELPFQDLQGRS